MIDQVRMTHVPRNESSRLPVFGRVTVGVCIVATLSACVKRLPPAPIPEPIAPPVQTAGPPPEGQGRLIVDVVEGPAPVQRVRIDARQRDHGGGRYTYSLVEVPELLCPAAPCIRDVPRGNILLGFPVIGEDTLEVELVHIGPEPSVYRRSLSIYSGGTGGLRIFGIIGTSVGGAAIATGAALLPIGLAKDNGGLTTAGAISLGAGSALLALGIWAIRRDSPTYRPGSSNHFPLAAPMAP